MPSACTGTSAVLYAAVLQAAPRFYETGWFLAAPTLGTWGLLLLAALLGAFAIRRLRETGA